MNPRYMFIVEGKSSNLLNPFDVITLPLGYKSQLIPIDFGGYKVLVDDGSTPTVLARLYNASKTFIQDVAITIGEWYPFTTLYSSARYVELSFSNATTPEHVFFGQEETFESWFDNELRPIWSDSLSVEYEKEGQEQFFRKKLSGQLTFVGTDYAYIKSKSIDYTFPLTIYMSNDNDQTWLEYWRGHFYWTDCEFNENDNNIKVTPAVDDEYVDILAGLEKEYNLIDLAPAVYEINLKKRPVIQIIPFKGDGSYSKAGCFKVDGTYWERDCVQVTWGGPIVPLMSQRYYFNIASGIVEMSITPQGRIPDGFPTHIKDMFIGHLYSTSHGYREYSLRHSFMLQSGQWRIELTYENPEITITKVSTGVVTWRGVWSGSTVTLTSQVSEYDNLSTTIDNPYILFSRLVFDKTGIDGAVSIPESDIMANNENYHYCLQEYDVNRYLYYTDVYSTTPTKWGKHDSSHYWIEPQESGVEGWSPIAFSTWDDIALWFGYTADLFPTEDATMSDALLRNAYKIEDCISVLLKKVAPNITLAASNFLSGIDPITNDTRTFFLTPKTNVKKINYDMPAMNAPITLKAIFDMLRNGYKAYWYVENNELHIEHLLWFLNGGRYESINPELYTDIDLTQTLVSRNGKSWAYGLNKYTFDKPEMTERYEFGWMDNVTLPFKGEPLNIIANFVEKGKVDKIDITQFSSDIDYILMNPEDISDDGFVLMGAVYENNSWSLAFKEFTDMDFVKLQNAYCAFVYMQRYYLYDLPASRYRIGERSEQYAYKTIKSKIQEVSFPCPTDPDMKKLVKTFIGFGQLDKLTINLSSRNGKATLKFEV